MDQRSNGTKLLRRGIREASLLSVRYQALREFVEIERAEMLSIQPHGFGIEGIFIGEIDDCVSAVDAFEREQLDELLARHLLAIVLCRPGEQATKVHRL